MRGNFELSLFFNIASEKKREREKDEVDVDGKSVLCVRALLDDDDGNDDWNEKKRETMRIYRISIVATV